VGVKKTVWGSPAGVGIRRRQDVNWLLKKEASASLNIFSRYSKKAIRPWRCSTMRGTGRKERGREDKTQVFTVD